MIKINKLELENVKRIKAVVMEPTANGLTIVGGRNNQGKTSVLDSIAWALGGEKYSPSEPHRDGSVLPPSLKLTMSNGLIVERKGKNSALKVTDPGGQKGGQQLLNEFVEQLAIDLPKFIQSTSKEKATTLLQIIGVGKELQVLELKENELFQDRLMIGRIADQKKKYAAELEFHTDAPKELVSISDLIKEQQEILAVNGENQRKREKLTQIESNISQVQTSIEWVQKEIEGLKSKLKKYNDEYGVLLADLEIANKDALDLQDESTEQLETSIENIEAINIKVRSNLDKDKADEDAKEHLTQYNNKTVAIDAVRLEKINLLKGVTLPLPGLSVADGELTYNGKKWDNMSGSDQLKVSTAIVRKLNPECGFVLLDKLEQMDLDTLTEFGTWLEAEGLQAIATRVSTGEECSIIIEDGYVAGADAVAVEEPKKETWKAGSF
ncbi:MAG: chromosome segregation protein SMC [Eubacteriaceae bacterium]|nr:chromosome segregation protein SMC [Eubacteriaceae bacterium]